MTATNETTTTTITDLLSDASRDENMAAERLQSLRARAADLARLEVADA